MKHVSLGVYDYSRKKQCDLYDSFSSAKGQATNIVLTKEISGWKEISFELPFVVDGADNFRWEAIRNETLLRVKVGEEIEWFIVNAPKKTNNGRAITSQIKCSHLSAGLKTKNLYLVFDDENGIGTINTLAERALSGTGWAIGACDVFYEQDGETEKIRSISSNGKRGAYQLIADICNLFNAYPVYHGDTKTVDLLSLNNKLPVTEMYIGKNINTQSVEYNSDNVITRMYVEGEYGDNGYVGIDDVNPTGLSYLLNFDYYKNNGQFTEEHQAALDQYLADMPAVKADIQDKMAEILEGENLLNTMWGQCDYVIYTLSNREIDEKIVGGIVLEDETDIAQDDELLVFKSEGAYRIVKAGQGGAVSWASDDIAAIKFVTQPSGTIGAQQVAIEAKERMIETLQSDYQAETDDQKKEQIEDQIEAYTLTIQDIYNGTATTSGLYVSMRTALEQAVYLNQQRGEQKELTAEQEQIENAFATAMGDMLRDGYWSDNNYAPGQEQILYWDAVERMQEASKPTVKYTVSLVRLSELMGYGEEVPDPNTAVRVLDDKLNLKDVVYVTKMSVYLDDPSKGSVELSNEVIHASAAQSFETVLGRVTQLADLVDQRNPLYERASAINSNGTLPADRVAGTINIQDNDVASTKSGWYTDESGSLIFESILRDSAFKITGDGIFLANSKTGTNWDWRAFGNGLGFDASALTSGQLNTDRIANGSVGSGKLGSNVGNELDISKNSTIIDPETGVFSQIEQTASQIRTEVSDSVNGLSSSITQTASQIRAEVNDSVNGLSSSITETATEIRADVYAANSQIYSTIQQTASSITATIEDTEQGLYSCIQQTASGIRQTFASQTNRTIVNDTDPRGATYTPKDGDIWIESVHDGTWDGADGFDWEHDEDYDWTQVQGAKVWTWKNNQWQLVADRQQLVTYSDFVNTADTLISQKITALANEEGMIEVYRSLIEQTGERIRSEVYSATSDIYSYIHQTASSIIISVDNHAQKTYVSDAIKDGPPEIIIGEDGIARDANGRTFLDGDTWINTADQDTWDKALEWNWDDDADYNWSDLRDDEIQRYDAEIKDWVPVVNGRVFTDPLEMKIADDRITANMRSIDVVNGKVEENAHQLSITTQELRSTFNDRISAVGSELLQTKSELRSDFYAANSQIYSYVIQTASSLTSHFENEIEDVGSNITQTASEIRSEVHASQSQIWSSITQTASQVAIKVGKGDVSTQLAVECGNVSISGGNLVVSGYITSQGLITTMGQFNGSIYASGSIGTPSTMSAKSIALDGESLTSYVLSFMQGSALYTIAADSNINLTHSHSISFSTSGGTVTATLGNEQAAAGTASFNIADTKFYKDGIASAKDDRSVKASSFAITNVTEYPSQNALVFNVEAIANDGTTYTSATQMLTYTGQSSPTITRCYARSFSVSSVSKYGDGYEVVGSVSIRAEFSDGTYSDYGPYTVRDVA